MENKKIKLALIITVFITGGAERMVQQLATHLDRDYVDVSVISVYPRQRNAMEAAIEKAGIPLYFLDKKRSKDPSAMLRMWNLLSNIQPDVIHSHLESTFYALPWAAAHRIPLLHTVHNQPEMEFSPTLRKVQDLMRKAGTLHFAAISQTNQALTAQYYGISPDQVPWVNNPVELGKYYHAEDCRSDITFIHLGRLNPQKNQRLAIQAMPQVLKAIPNARLLIVGEGELRQELEQQIQELGLSDAVCLYGLTQEPEHLLANADVYVNPSNFEGLPLAILEAEASGLPIIATDVGGVGDIVRDNGVLIPAGDLNALVKEMIRFGTDSELRVRCGRASLPIAREYDAGLCSAKYMEIYKNIRNCHHMKYN